MKFIFLLFFGAIQLPCFAQSWQISGYSVDSKVLANNATVPGKTILISVSDNTGAPVNGISSAQFLAFQEVCNESGGNCIASPMEISKGSDGKYLFQKLGQGLYRITFNLITPLTASPANSILVQVILPPMLRVANTIKAQILFQ